MLSVLFLPLRLVIPATGRGQTTDIKVTVPTVLDETTTSAMSTTATTGCSGPGWRHVAFISMTDTSYNCPTGLTSTSYSKRTCGQLGEDALQLHSVLEVHHTAVCVEG